MGGIREQYGRITIESRRESFYIHASYGYRPATVAMRDLMPGDYFLETPPIRAIRQVETVAVDSLSLFGGGSYRRSDVRVIPCDKDGDPLDTESDPESGSFGEIWREGTSPEFLNEDLEDLIAALVELRDNPR